MRTRRWILLLVCVVASAPAIGAAQPSTPLPPRHVLTIGVEDGPDEYIFSAPVAVLAGPRGEIVVLDAREANVRVYDAAGRFLRSFGRRGGGPGEFVDPFTLALVDTVAFVTDLNGRMTVFSLAGHHLRDVTLPHIHGGLTRSMHPLRHGQWLATRAALFSNLQVDNREILLFVPAGPVHADTLSAHHAGSILVDGPQYAMPHPTQFHAGREVVWSVGGDSMVVLVDGYQGVVRWYEVARRGLEPHAERRLGGWGVTRIDRQQADEIRRQVAARNPRAQSITVPEFLGRAAAALLDDQGRVWIQRRTGVESTREWWVVSPDADAPVVRLEMPDGFTLRHVRGDRLYGTARTEIGAPVIRVLQWTGQPLR
jgi:hypothetical protein